MKTFTFPHSCLHSRTTSVRHAAGSAQHGVVLLEAILTIPLIILLVLFFIWFATLVNARAGLMSTIENGIRAAATRGRVDLTGSELLPEITDWRCGATNAPSGALQKLLFSKEFLPELPIDVYDSWNSHLTPQLRDLPLHNLYALIYILEGMKGTIGSSLRYPCDPASDAGAGCLKCFFLNPGTLTTEAATQEEIDMTLLRTAVQCDYRVEGVLAGTIDSLLRLTTGASGPRSIVSYTATWELPQDLFGWQPLLDCEELRP